MKRKQTIFALLITSLFIALVSSGCYTKLYRPGMETDGPFSSNTLYNRYDSSAIDTTLLREDWIRDYYPDDGWSYWGGYRDSYHHPRWGFDFYNFSPGYYSSYYGYYDYYGSPWWYRNNYHRPWYYGGGGYGGGGDIGEPPSQRDGRRTRPGYSDGTGAYGTPPSGGTGGTTYQQPSGGSSGGSGGGSNTGEARNDNSTQKGGSSSDDGGQKRNGKRRR